MMKKYAASVGLALLLAVTPASAAFSDISDSKLTHTTTILDSLGIMQGVGNGRFAPDSVLTRAQFCKLAVTALGVTDVNGYSSYTIFPDVPSTHWASPYINAAVRDTELKKLSIIRGYADGTFSPDKTVSFAEACTMLLRMLGYTDLDVGPFWPQDYIAFAQNLGLTEDVSVGDPNAAVKRSDAATMLLNTLGAKRKDGDSDILLNKVTSSTVKDCILLATSDTDSTLAENEALFYEGGTVSDLPRRTAGKLDKSMIGTSGTIVIGKENDKVALGIIPNNNKTEVIKVTEVAADGIRTERQKITPNRDTKLYVAREKKLDTYANLWSSIVIDDELTMYYDEYGALELMAVLPRTVSVAPHTFVFGIATSVKIPEEYAIIKNGVKVDNTQLKKYDVVTLDHANKQALVSDVKLTGVYQEGTPTFRYPQVVKVYNDTYKIADTSAKMFRDFELGDRITLLFNTEGDIAAVYPKASVNANMEGIITALDDKNEATIALMNGLTVHATLKEETVETTKVMGEMVTLSQLGSIASVTIRDNKSKEPGIWNIKAGTLGSRNVSPTVRVFEQVQNNAPLNQIALSDVKKETIASNQIRYTFVDSAGSITGIVLGDVTGKSWMYGLGYTSSSGSGEDVAYTAGLRYWDGSETVMVKFPVDELPRGLGSVPVGIPKGYSEKAINKSFVVQSLKEIDAVGLDAFEGTSGVHTKSGYYDIVDGIGVYIKSQDRMCSLLDAKNNYSKFILYADKMIENGGRVCLIIAED